MIAHFIGDSHASFFSGYDEIQPAYPEASNNKYSFLKGIRLGSVLAHSLNKQNTTERGNEKLFEAVKGIDKSELVFLWFGEIDCRCHLIKQAQLQQKPLGDVVKACVDVYFEAAGKIAANGYRVGLLAILPSAESDNPEYPTFGTMQERNECSRIFNAYLEAGCKQRNLHFVSFFRYLINRDNTSRTEYYFDSIHLGQVAMPFALWELNKTVPDLVQPHYSTARMAVLLQKARMIAFLKFIKRKHLR